MTQKAPEGLEIASHEGPGYKPLIRSSGDWMAAIMNGQADSWKVPASIEKHPGTDELFVLTAGRAMLITAGSGEKPGKVEQVEMKRNVLYNVKAGVWHVSPQSPDATFIIIEATGTEIDGSVRAPLTKEQQATIKM